MLLSIAAVVVVVLLVVALLPTRKRDRETTQSPTGGLFTGSASIANLRMQQVEEEAEAIASEYRRRADEAWLEELNEKASSLFKGGPSKTPRRS